MIAPAAAVMACAPESGYSRLADPASFRHGDPMTLDTLLQQPNALPTAPKVVEELISSFLYPNVSVDEIVRKLSADPVLSAKLLRLANSAYYNVSRTIGTVDDAVRMLGFVAVRTLVISSSLVGGFRKVPGLDLKRFWRYSLHTAVSAKWLAARVDDNADLAFTIGMMHALGELVIHTGLPEEAEDLDKVAGIYEPGRAAAEQQAFGFDYGAVGAELALRWKFPDIFAATIRSFADPARHGDWSRLPAVLHLAVWRAQAEENEWNEEEQAATLPLDVARALGLDGELVMRQMPALAELTAGLEDLVS
jgi:HD-like signal output (HDOD) protein